MTTFDEFYRSELQQGLSEAEFRLAQLEKHYYRAVEDGDEELADELADSIGVWKDEVNFYLNMSK